MLENSYYLLNWKIYLAATLWANQTFKAALFDLKANSLCQARLAERMPASCQWNDVYWKFIFKADAAVKWLLGTRIRSQWKFLLILRFLVLLPWEFTKHTDPVAAVISAEEGVGTLPCQTIHFLQLSDSGACWSELHNLEAILRNLSFVALAHHSMDEGLLMSYVDCVSLYISFCTSKGGPHQALFLLQGS